VLEEELLGGNHIVISDELNDISHIQTHALVDCGATGYALADEEFVVITISLYTSLLHHAPLK